MRLPPGSFLWLVAHDLRLSARRFRGLFGKLHEATMALVIVVAIVLLHLLAWPVATWLGGAEGGADPGALSIPALASATIFIMPWLVSQALNGATRALYSRGDLDLLLASPLSARTILAARALAIAIDSVSSVAIFLLPVADMNVLMGRWHWLALYPALLSCGLFATALGLVLTMGLFAIAGPRRTRLIAQIAATLIGAPGHVGADGTGRHAGVERCLHWLDDHATLFRACCHICVPAGCWLYRCRHSSPRPRIRSDTT